MVDRIVNDTKILTDRFLIRELSLDDVSERYVGWLNHKETSRFIDFAQIQTHTIESVTDYVKEQIQNKDVLFLAIFLRHAGLHIGNIKFDFIDHVKSSAEIGILLGEPEWRGRGVAVEVLHKLSKYLHDELGISEINLCVDSANQPAIRAYEKANYSVQLVNQAETSIEMSCRYSAAHMPPTRLALGTVQFGQPYGIANQDGQVSRQEVREILQIAGSSGVDTLDTAAGYGNSEQVLGTSGVKDWRVVTKVPPIPKDCDDVRGWLRGVVSESLEKLELLKLKGLLLHRPLDLLGREGGAIYQTLTTFKNEGLVEKIGYSIYAPSDLDALWDSYRPDLVQVPFNVFDRRIHTSGWLQKMQQAGTEIHSRSVFLQGLLLMDNKDRPEKFNRWDDQWRNWQDWLRENNLSPLQGALAFVRSQPEIDRIVVGVDNSQHLSEILAAIQVPIHFAPLNLACDDEELVDPSKWNQA